MWAGSVGMQRPWWGNRGGMMNPNGGTSLGKPLDTGTSATAPDSGGGYSVDLNDPSTAAALGNPIPSGQQIPGAGSTTPTLIHGNGPAPGQSPDWTPPMPTTQPQLMPGRQGPGPGESPPWTPPLPGGGVTADVSGLQQSQGATGNLGNFSYDSGGLLGLQGGGLDYSRKYNGPQSPGIYGGGNPNDLPPAMLNNPNYNPNYGLGRMTGNPAMMPPQTAPQAQGNMGMGQQVQFGNTADQQNASTIASGLDGRARANAAAGTPTVQPPRPSAPGPMETAPSTLDPRSMAWLLQWMGGSPEAGTGTQQSNAYLDQYRQQYGQQAPGGPTNYLGPNFRFTPGQGIR
jgi:hypothetical protein